MHDTLKIDMVHNPVGQLRQLGYTVRVTHYRLYVDWKPVINAMAKPSFKNIRLSFIEKPKFEGDIKFALPRGGKTVVSITKPNGVTLEAESICRIDDQFCKREGVKKAIARILRYL